MRAPWRLLLPRWLAIRALWSSWRTTVVWGRSRSRVLEDGCWFFASAVCRHTLAGFERVTTQRSHGSQDRRRRRLLPQPAKRRAGNSASERRRREGENACNATIPHNLCGVSFELAHPPLPHQTMESANRRMHQSQRVHAFFEFFQL